MNRRLGSYFMGVGMCAVSLVSHADVSAQGKDQTPITDKYLQPGPYGYGMVTLPLTDPARPTPAHGNVPATNTRNLPTHVYYPAADTAASGGTVAAAALPQSAPLVVYGHGLASSKEQVSYFAKHLASHGYVVAAMDFPLSHVNTAGGAVTSDVQNQVGDMLYVAGVVRAFTPAPFHDVVSPSLVAYAGHSLGGLTAALVPSNAPAGLEPDATLLMAPAACALFLQGGPGAAPIQVPSLILGGETDSVTPFGLNFTPLYQNNASPKFLAKILNGSHLGFVTNAPALESSFAPAPIDAGLCSILPQANDPVAQACGFCTTLPSAPQLPAQRQLDITRAMGLAFLEAYLRSEPLPEVFLEQIAERENDELVVTYDGPHGVGH